MQKYFILSLLLFTSCEVASTYFFTHHPDYSELYEALYHEADSVIHKEDTIIVINKKYDTTLIATGVFAYMHYDYPTTTDPDLVALIKQGIELEQQGKPDQAIRYYQKVAYYYDHVRPEILEGFSDTNDYLRHGVDETILYAYAYDKLGDIDKSIAVLQPFTANIETYGSKIVTVLLRQYVKKYGRATVEEAIKSCGKTIHYHKDDSPEKETWAYTLLGTEIGIEDSFNTDTVTVKEADRMARNLIY